MAFEIPVLCKLKKNAARTNDGELYVLFYSPEIGMVVKNTMSQDVDPVGVVRTNWVFETFKKV